MSFIHPKLYISLILIFFIQTQFIAQVLPVDTAKVTSLKSDTIQKNKPVVTKSKKSLSVDFILPTVEYDQVAVMSNVLRVINNSTKEYTFSVKLSLPSGWKTLNKSDKKYIIAPNDSVFIAVRVLTNNISAKGGTKYNIIAFITTDAGIQMGSSSFLAGRPKISNWQMRILPRPRIYFLNNQNEAPFQLNLTNDGDEQEQVILSMNKIGKDFSVTDSSGKFLKKNFMDLSLRPQSDTIIPFTIQVQKTQLNLKRIDTYGYVSNAQQVEKHYGLFFKASEVAVRPGKTINKNSKADFIKLANSIDFVKLNDKTKVNQYGASVIPLTMIANINNILGQQPIMNLVFQGNTALNKKSRMDYFMQSGFAYYKYDNRSINNISGILNYYHEKYFVSAGTGVGLNYNNLRGISSGRGVSGGYVIKPNQTIGGYFLRNGQSFFNYQSTSIGAAYSQKIKKVVFGAGIDATNYITGNSTRAVNGNVFYPINRNQNIGFLGQYTSINYNGGNLNSNYFAVNYSIRYAKGRALSSVNFSRNEGNASVSIGQIYNTYTRNMNAALTSSYRFKKRSELRLINNYNEFHIPGYSQNNFLFSNVLSYALPENKKVNYTPGAYFNYSSYFNERLISSGLQLSLNTNNLDNNYRFGFFLKGGYNKLLDYSNLGTFFTAQTNSYLSYRTWNLFLRYFYGPQGVSNIVYTLNNQKIYSQSLSGSLSNQYQFKNKHFVWENTVNYTYLNVNNRHNMGLFSQLYYYTNAGWRFNVNLLYNINVYESYKYTYSTSSPNNFYSESTNKKMANQNFQLGVGILKNFAIPIPKKFRKNHFTDANLKAFLDLNGNKIFDQDEVALENIVVRFNENEVLTNNKGEATFANLGLGRYKIEALSLIDIGAWFPVINDSIDVISEGAIYIPFSQGVQIIGNVQIDREKYSGDIQSSIDISRIKIFLVDSLGKVVTSVTDNKGNFKFYMPYGSYTLKFDEKILGAGFELVQNDVPVELLNGIDSFFHTFFIVEKKRKVVKKKFDADGNVIESKDEEIKPSKTNNTTNQFNSKKFDADGNLVPN